MSDLIHKGELFNALANAHDKGEIFAIIQNAPTVDVSEISDGYHTFADLYEQRLILSAALAKDNPYAWKSKLHSDGTEPFCGGWFVMGWKTEKGQYTYHYEMKDWELFECREIPRAPEWDGHTSNDVRRLLTLPTVDDVPVAELLKLRDWLYESDGITMGGLRSLNEVIAKYSTKELPKIETGYERRNNVREEK